MWYVTMTDKFLSGWGMAANKISKIVVECETISQAREVQEKCSERTDMIRVNICANKPRYNSSRYHVSERVYKAGARFAFE